MPSDLEGLLEVEENRSSSSSPNSPPDPPVDEVEGGFLATAGDFLPPPSSSMAPNTETPPTGFYSVRRGREGRDNKQATV